MRAAILAAGLAASSLARAATLPADAAAQLGSSGSAACARCHPDVAAQWSASAHHAASFANPYYAAAARAFERERGRRATRFCADCHDPALVAAGLFDRDAPGPLDEAAVDGQAGIGCLLCHSITAIDDRRGNGCYRLRADPAPPIGEEHRRRLRPPLLADPELCGGCHKVGLTEEVTGARWLRGQDDLDPWYDAAIAGRGAPAILRPSSRAGCQDCHMPLEAAPRDLGAHRGPDGPMVRSHRFAAANGALPHLAGDPAQEARVSASLVGAVSIDLASARAGSVDVVLRNRRVGHRFPGGTNDSNEVWIEVIARDAAGRPVAASGLPDGDGAIDPSAHRLRAQAVDDAGRPLARRDVQHARGLVFDTSLAPAEPQAVRYRLPDGAASVEARLLYRKFDRGYLRFACATVGPAARARCQAAPTVAVATARAPIVDGRVASPDDAERLLAWGLALLGTLADRASDARAPLERAAALLPDRVEPRLALARLAVALGRTDEALARLDALDGQTRQPALASLFLRATSAHAAYRSHDARAAAERLAARLPDDRIALGLLARLRGLDGDAVGALAAAERLLAIDPESEEGLFQRTLALRDLGRDARDAEASFLRHRRAVEIDLALRARFSVAYPALADEAEPLHTHALAPPRERSLRTVR